MRNTIKPCLFDRNILILLIVTIGILPDLVSTGGFYIWSDVTSQMLPFVYESKRMFASGIPFWSWNTYLGDNFYAPYAFYTVFNPFSWINFLFPYRYLGLGFTMVLYLKFLVCGYVSQKYLEKLGFGHRLSLIGCLLYTFSSWSISNLFYYMFVEPMIAFPLLLLFIEKFLRGDKHGCTGLAMAAFVVIMINYYFAPASFIAATIYFFTRLCYLTKNKTSRLHLTLRAAGSVLLGIVCASLMLIPVAIKLSEAPHAPYPDDYFNVFETLDRILWLLFPKAHEAGTSYILFKRTWNSNAASIAIFGLLPILLLFTKKGHGWIKWFAGILLVLYMTPLNGVFSLFTELYYTRWAYALSLAIIIGTLYYLKDYGMPRMRYAIWYCAIVYGAFFLFNGASVYWQIHNGSDVEVASRVPRLMLDAGLVATNVVALLIVCSKRLRNNPRFTPTLASVAVCVTVQLLVFTIPNVKGFPHESRISGENEYFLNDTDFRNEGDFSYRTDFSRLGPERTTIYNMGLICNRPSLQTFHSIQSKRARAWNEIVGRTYDKDRAFYPEKFRKSFEALTSVKESVVLAEEVTDTCISGKMIMKDGLFNVYETDHYIPMGFAYDTYITSDMIDAHTADDKNLDIPLILLSALAVKPEDEKELSTFMKKGRITEEISLDSVVARRRRIVCDKFTGNTRGFDAHIDADSAAVVFFSVVADEGFNAYVDGEPTKIYETNLGFSSVVVPAGSHDITFRYFPPGLKLGLLFSAIGIAILALLYKKGF